MEEQSTEAKPEYTPVRISDLPRAAAYLGSDMVLLARPRSGGSGPNASYTTVAQALSSLSAQVLDEARAAFAETSGVISSAQQLQELGQSGELADNPTRLVGGMPVYEAWRLLSAAASRAGGNTMYGDNVFMKQPVLSGEAPAQPADEAFATYGQVKSYLSGQMPSLGMVYSPGTRWNVVSSFGNKTSSSFKLLGETFQYRVQRDCELHLHLESVATAQIQPSTMSVYVKAEGGDEHLVYVFADNDNDSYVSHYWCHAVKAGMYVVLRTSVANGKGWYLRRIAEVC